MTNATTLRARVGSFVWTDDEVELLLLRVTLDYKSTKFQENVDWESCHFKYSDIMDAFQTQYLRQLTNKDFPHDATMASKAQVIAKLKNIRSKYRHAVDTVRRSGKTSDMKNLHVKTVKHGEAVTMECDINGLKNKNTSALYRQSFGNVPQVFVRQFGQSYTFVDGFNDNRFSVTVNGDKFDLNINEIREDDGGEYFCGELEGTVLKFTSGTRLQFEGEEMKPCPTPGTLNKNTHSVTHQGSNSREGKGASSNNHQTPTNQADDEDVLNDAAVSFAKKPSSSRTSRDTRIQDVYTQVIYLYNR
ncbi:uncharacterized protein LOC128514924 [Clarias gariepinus]|uniref:uncharacterized protein LOC128514924 n=1 Tax=Clarias gariepinus TaxID=13013 RepID=UPI00234D05FD|nr:uncharacterized protein LOC128514924 [Clarias gariepinus]